jgi:formamidopyrimidine-DNA glycosylase
MFHFGMTGYLDYAKIGGEAPRHSRFVLSFENGFRLAYVNQRRLGRIRIAKDFGVFLDEHALGPDALHMGRDVFVEMLTAGRGAVKTRLMNQKLIAGLGNVYTDEVLFQAGVHPGVSATDITPDRAAGLWRTVRHVLRIAIERRARPDRFPASWLTPHRDDRQCPRCGSALKRGAIGGRTTRFCPACQSFRSTSGG